MLFGTAFYNGNVRTFADVQYDPIAENGKDGESSVEMGRVPATMASPSLMRSVGMRSTLVATRILLPSI